MSNAAASAGGGGGQAFACVATCECENKQEKWNHCSKCHSMNCDLGPFKQNGWEYHDETEKWFCVTCCEEHVIFVLEGGETWSGAVPSIIKLNEADFAEVSNGLEPRKLDSFEDKVERLAGITEKEFEKIKEENVKLKAELDQFKKPALVATFNHEVDEAEFNDMFEEAHKKKPEAGAFAKFVNRVHGSSFTAASEMFWGDISEIIEGMDNDEDEEEDEQSDEEAEAEKLKAKAGGGGGSEEADVFKAENPSFSAEEMGRK